MIDPMSVTTIMFPGAHYFGRQNKESRATCWYSHPPSLKDPGSPQPRQKREGGREEDHRYKRAASQKHDPTRRRSDSMAVPLCD
ncbi:uncharacterized protein B0I36DRAFT_88593 [Microdochium trichocladiopsis]|uniref:Uncharacterized protein n=1 Tax=Microdochium trichocladiopsis TaxID=1682393 RepID=A0A9P9BT50_9PEZI|nr:uncharacterized protein B0I36DRAFT_88593 [Microdochium trichocladiopsis]KAH7035132.1 hypothetical protein B0I36DRAFT_88593 [Microdochium trichocladiopsis]